MFYWEIITWPKGSLWRWVLPLSNNISVGFNQIVRDISGGQILQSVFVTDFHLDKQTKKWHLRLFFCRIISYLTLECLTWFKFCFWHSNCVTNLRWWKATRTSRALWKHPLAPFAAALTQWRWILHWPVAFVEQVLQTLGNLRYQPIILNSWTERVPGAKKAQVYVQLQISTSCIQYVQNNIYVIFMFVFPKR